MCGVYCTYISCAILYKLTSFCTGDPNNISCQSSYVQCPQGTYLYMVFLHGILSRCKPSIYYIYAIINWSNVTNLMVLFSMSWTHIITNHITNASAVIIIRNLSLPPNLIWIVFSDLVLLTFLHFIIWFVTQNLQ